MEYRTCSVIINRSVNSNKFATFLMQYQRQRIKILHGKKTQK